MESTEKLELLRLVPAGDGRSVVGEKREPGEDLRGFSSRVKARRRRCEPAGDDVALFVGESTAVAIKTIRGEEEELSMREGARDAWRDVGRKISAGL